MGTTTTTFALNKPTVGGDDNTWGTDWNSNADKLDDLLDGTTGITPNLIAGWEVGGVAVTASAAELNLLDGVTASTAEINILDGVTASTAEINLLDGVTASTAELNILDGVTASTAELNILDGVTASTAEINYLVGVTSDIQTQLNGLSGQAGTVLLGTVNTTSGSVQTLSGLDLTPYKFLIFEFIGVSHNSGTSQSFNIGTGRATDTENAASLNSGMVWVSLANGNVYLEGRAQPSNSNATGYSTATTSVSVSPSAGSFDAGSIRIYGVK
jgi:hypothetical protein